MTVARVVIIALLMLISVFRVDAGETPRLSAVEFMNRVRYPSAQKTWAALNGTVAHRRRGQETMEAPLYFGIMFSPVRTLAQIVIDNRQGYYVGQTFTGAESGTSIIPLNKKGYEKPLLALYGLRPEDLTMTFIYWRLLGEEEPETVKTFYCRVFLLQSPKSDETVKVYISKYYFPLKAEWFKAKATKPYRTMEVRSSKKVNKLWVVKRIGLYGPGWRTRVDFDDIKAGMIKDGVPKELFHKISAEK